MIRFSHAFYLSLIVMLWISGFPNLQTTTSLPGTTSSSLTSDNAPPIVGTGAANATTSFRSPFPSTDAKIVLKPLYGQHRPFEDAILTFVRGYTLEQVIVFISSLMETNYTGDLVLGVDSIIADPGLKQYYLYLAQHHHAVIYPIKLDCFHKKRAGTWCSIVGLYSDSNGSLKNDTRRPRYLAMLRFEYYHAWALQYSATNNSRIFLLDARDVYFQDPPFPPRYSSSTNTLHVFAEHLTIGQEKYNRGWIRSARGPEWVQLLAEKQILCAGSTLADQSAMITYLRAMIQQYDDYRCINQGCDQAYHNILVHGGLLLASSADVQIHPRGDGVVNTIGLLVTTDGKKSLRERGLLGVDGKQVMNNDGITASPIVHQYERDVEFESIVNVKRQAYLDEWRRIVVLKL